MTQLLPPKKEVALALLERSNVDVYLDPRAQGVVVPPQFRKEPRLILKIGLNMPVPIPDLRLDDESMSCTLSFNRVKFYCVVPWLSVFAMVGDDGRGMVWPDDVPQELAVRVVDERGSAPALREEGPASSRGGDKSGGRGEGKGKPRLQVQPGPSSSESGDAGAPSERGPRTKRPRKKKEEQREVARPVLVAVPTPKKPSPKVEKLDDRREQGGRTSEASERSASRDADKPAPSPAPKADKPEKVEKTERPAVPVRPKRELPPYLRVVK